MSMDGEFINHYLLGDAAKFMRLVINERRRFDIKYAVEDHVVISYKDSKKNYTMSANYNPVTQYKKGITK